MDKLFFLINEIFIFYNVSIVKIHKHKCLGLCVNINNDNCVIVCFDSENIYALGLYDDLFIINHLNENELKLLVSATIDVLLLNRSKNDYFELLKGFGYGG